LNGPERVITSGTNKAMYYDANGADYIQTPSFAIPDTGILTIEAWVKNIDYSNYQFVLGDANQSASIGFIQLYRIPNSSNIGYMYANTISAVAINFNNFFLNLNNQ